MHRIEFNYFLFIGAPDRSKIKITIRIRFDVSTLSFFANTPLKLKHKRRDFI